MPNTVSQQEDGVALWRGRPVVVLREDDGRNHYLHAVLIGPKGMTLATALRELDAALHKAKKAHGDEWTYDNVVANARAVGFEDIHAATWWEGLADKTGRRQS